ncbi:MAG: Nre family DNA repair protein [Thaumarchaeota archaeon]|nr:Nre family DNA repair protein [Nitrososphaerota archaeon]
MTAAEADDEGKKRKGSAHPTSLIDVIPSHRFGELGAAVQSIGVVSRYSDTTCLYCKGGKMLCGKSTCPLIAKAISMARPQPKIDALEICGAAPPGVFVGREGYPKVYIGPMVPPYYENTEILDAPERWVGKQIEDIIDYRYSLIRGKVRTSIEEPRVGGRFLDSLQELSMASQPVDSEVIFSKRPDSRLTLSSDVQPFGPSAPLKSFKTSSLRVDRRIERAYYDRDLRAVDAVADLYSRGVSVSRIQRSFSLGMFGAGGRRKLVPTRWSITAVDDGLSLHILDKVKQFETIDEYRVYVFRNLDNIFTAILSPEKWKFEWIEAWFPGTTWNEGGSYPVLMGDHEPYWGRKTYAAVGGCYYSARLAAVERLIRERRQASALILREIHPRYILPVGVWNVRESVRAAFRGQPLKFDNFDSAIRYACSILTIPLQNWVETSTLLKEAFFQRKISDFW